MNKGMTRKSRFVLFAVCAATCGTMFASCTTGIRDSILAGWHDFITGTTTTVLEDTVPVTDLLFPAAE